VLLNDTSVASFGRNFDGELGIGTMVTDRDVPTPVCAVAATPPCSGTNGNVLTGVSALSANYELGLALLSDTTVVAWGSNQDGNLGTGATSGPESCSIQACSTKPVHVCELEYSGTFPCPSPHYLSGVSAVSAGSGHPVALMSNTTVSGWNEVPGNGTGASLVPVSVCAVYATPPCSQANGNLLTGATAVSSDVQASLAIAPVPSVVPPHWYSNGELIPEGEAVRVTSTGQLTLTKVEVEETEVTCTLKDKETIENPVGGGPGTDKLTALTMTSCFIPTGPKDNAAICGSQSPTVTVKGLPWATREIAGSPVRDEIAGIELEVKCSNNDFHETFTGALAPNIGNSVLLFDATTGELQGSYGATPVIGYDDLEGPRGDETITAEAPGSEPHWYSDGEIIGDEPPVSVATHGTITLHAMAGALEVTCKVRDSDTIENPAGGGAGIDEMTSFVLSGCKAPASVCSHGEKLEVRADAPLSTRLLAGTPIRDEVAGIELKVICRKGSSETVLDVLTGSLTPEVGASILDFGAGSGELEESAGPDKATVTGTDKLKGPAGDRKITARAL
jgi:hypothetical protein